jgi:hypothetical protein
MPPRTRQTAEQVQEALDKEGRMIHNPQKNSVPLDERRNRDLSKTGNPVARKTQLERTGDGPSA